MYWDTQKAMTQIAVMTERGLLDLIYRMWSAQVGGDEGCKQRGHLKSRHRRKTQQTCCNTLEGKCGQKLHCPAAIFDALYLFVLARTSRA